MEKICQVYYDAAAATAAAEAEAYLYHASESTIRFQQTLHRYRKSNVTSGTRIIMGPSKIFHIWLTCRITVIDCDELKISFLVVFCSFNFIFETSFLSAYQGQGLLSMSGVLGKESIHVITCTYIYTCTFLANICIKS